MSINHTAIGNIVVDTDSILIAIDIARMALKKDAVRGKIRYQGKTYQWSTYQQYEHHNGFTGK